MTWHYRIVGDTVFADVYFNRAYIGRLTFTLHDFALAKHDLDRRITFIDATLELVK